MTAGGPGDVGGSGGAGGPGGAGEVGAAARSAQPSVRVLMTPDFTDRNPYQRLLVDALEPHGVRVTLTRAPGRDPVPLARGWVRARRPDVLHLHWTHTYLRGGRATAERFLLQVRAIRALGTRVVWTMHNLGGHDGGLGEAERAVHRRLVGLADAVICHCEAAREAAIRAYGLPSADAARLHVVPHGSYLGAYPDTVTPADARSRLGIPPDARTFLFVGAVRGYKGTDDLVGAFRDLEDPAARLVIAGAPGSSATEAALRAAAAADPRILLHLAFVAPDALQDLLRAADAVVLPFRDILTSGSAILALSFGRPVIAPALGCLPETVPSDAGIRYDPDAPDGLAGALRAALGADLVTMGEQALVRAWELDWGAIAGRTAQLYRGGRGDRADRADRAEEVSAARDP